jgi:hypothetical protein
VDGRKRRGCVCTSAGDDLLKARFPPLLYTVGGSVSLLKDVCFQWPA